MEKELMTTEQPLSTGLTVTEALQSNLKIIDSNDQELMNALGYCFALIGLNPEEYPKGLKRTFLIDFIRSNYKYYNTQEIKVAFLMLVKGELSESPKHYNNFSPEYFGSVMKLYKTHREKALIDLSWKQKQNKVQEPYVPDSVRKVQIQKEFDEVVVKPIFEKYKQFGVIDFGTTPAKFIYNSLTAYHKVIEFSEEQKLEIMEQAKVIIEQRKEHLKNVRASSYREHKEKLKMIKELVDNDHSSDETIKESQIICIKLCFDKMIENNFSPL